MNDLFVMFSAVQVGQCNVNRISAMRCKAHCVTLRLFRFRVCHVTKHLCFIGKFKTNRWARDDFVPEVVHVKFQIPQTVNLLSLEGYLDVLQRFRSNFDKARLRHFTADNLLRAFFIRLELDYKQND